MSVFSVRVLILVLMEYALWEVAGELYTKYGVVLILVLMEYALWGELYTKYGVELQMS